MADWARICSRLDNAAVPAILGPTDRPEPPVSYGPDSREERVLRSFPRDDPSLRYIEPTPPAGGHRLPSATVPSQPTTPLRPTDPATDSGRDTVSNRLHTSPPQPTPSAVSTPQGAIICPWLGDLPAMPTWYSLARRPQLRKIHFGLPSGGRRPSCCSTYTLAKSSPLLPVFNQSFSYKPL